MEKALRLNAEQREDLVAYLDGELPDAETQHIDQVLARSEVARHEVEALARTWELLDLLAKPNARADFTTRTLTTLKLSEVQTSMTEQPWFGYVRQGAGAVVCVAVLALFATGGFLVTSQLVPNPQAELLTYLPLVRNLDLYLALNDFEFAGELRRQSLFTTAAAEGGQQAANAAHVAPQSTAGVTPQELWQRYDVVSRSPETERDRIRRNWEAWKGLTPARQAQMQELHRQIAQEPAEFHTMLETYALWLQTLTLGQREDLRQAADAGARVELVRRFKSQQDDQNEKRLFELRLDSRMPKLPPVPLTSDEFALVMAAARKELAAVDRPRIEAMPAGTEKHLETLRILMFSVRERKVSETAVDNIIAAIPSDKERQRIERYSRKEDRAFQLMQLVGRQMFEELQKDLPSDQDLQEFFLSDKLSSEDRFALMQKHPFELKRELERKFLEQTDNARMRTAGMVRWRLMEVIFGGPRFPFGGDRGPFGPGGRGFPEGRGPDGRFGPGQRPLRPGDRDNPPSDKSPPAEQR
jgi:hypothetical protein